MLEAVRMELNFQSMEIQEQRMIIDEQLQPMYDQLDNLHRQNGDIWDDDSFEGMDEEIRNRRKLLDNLHDQLQLSWDSFDQSNSNSGPAKDWSNYDSEIDNAWNNYHAEIESIQNRRSQAYSAQNDADAAASVKDISVIEQEYVSKISDYNNQVIQIQAEIDALSSAGNSTAGAKSALISEIEALNIEIENARVNLTELRNAKTAAQDALISTPEQIEGTVDSDGDGRNDLIDNPEYASLIAEIADKENTIVGIEQDINFKDSQISTKNNELNQLNENSSDSNPELTALISKRDELNLVINDLNTELQTKKDEAANAQSTDSSGQSTVDLTALENELATLEANALNNRESAIAAIDNSYYGSSNANEPPAAAGLKSQIEALEDEIESMDDQRHQYHKNREQRAKQMQTQIRNLEAQIDPLRDQQKELERQERPIRKQQMALDKENMMLEMQRQQSQDADDDAIRDQTWGEFDKWIQIRQDEVEDLTKQNWDNFEDEAKDLRRDLERAMEDERDALDQKRKDSEKAFKEQEKTARIQIENEQERIFEEVIAPLEAQAKDIESQIDAKFAELDSLYETQENYKSQLESLQARVQELDRQAEFGLLSVINDAISNVEQLDAGGTGRAIGFDSLLDLPTNND